MSTSPELDFEVPADDMIDRRVMAELDDTTTTSRSVEGVAIHAADRNWALGELGPCLIVVWRGTVTDQAIDETNKRIWDVSQRRPGNCAFITVIEPRSPHPNAQQRKLAMAGLARPGKDLSCKCAAIEGNELRSTVVRAILTGMALLRRQEAQPTKWFKNTTEMARWVRTQIQDPTDLESEIVRAVEVVRSQMPK